MFLSTILSAIWTSKNMQDATKYYYFVPRHTQVGARVGRVMELQPWLGSWELGGVGGGGRS